ncbi:hypothetical protein FACS189449_10200 [Alphaproteobacteria bacterium]|nr:hypothetical protein FACS189449_10200 [Alphaproteobacteria bacterium]
MDKNKLRDLMRDPSEDYYLAAFKKLEDTGKNTWNWAAFGGGAGWFCYRKMFWRGVLFDIVCRIMMFAFAVAFGCAGELVSAMTMLAAFAICCVFLGVFGNRIYYGRVKKNIKKGYHLCEKYRSTSPVMFFLGGFAALFIWIRDKCLLRDVRKNNTSFDNAIDEKNIKAAIATKSEDYYMDKFRKIESGKIISLNWASYFGGAGWFFYRKMYLYGSLFLIANVLLQVPFLCDFFVLLPRLLQLPPVLLPNDSLLLFNDICFLLKQNAPYFIASMLLGLAILLGGANRLYYHHLTKNKE